MAWPQTCDAVAGEALQSQVGLNEEILLMDVF
jgi:hypothetical protein